MELSKMRQLGLAFRLALGSALGSTFLRLRICLQYADYEGGKKGANQNAPDAAECGEKIGRVIRFQTLEDFQQRSGWNEGYWPREMVGANQDR